MAARARSSELTRVTGARCFDEIWEQMVKCIRTTGVIEKCRSPTSQKLADNTVAFSGRKVRFCYGGRSRRIHGSTLGF